MAKKKRPIVLTVLDGWGYRAETQGNAIALARKPTYDALIRKFPNTMIHTSGPSVGLPDGQMGNSEVGHLNIGAGRIVHMDMTRIDLLVANKRWATSRFSSKPWSAASSAALHLLGFISDGGVHSHHQSSLRAARSAAQERVQNVFVHCFMDGRDTPPHSGREYLQHLQHKMRELGTGQIATINGRYYAMDRDNRWEREEIAYRAMVHGEAEITHRRSRRRDAAQLRARRHRRIRETRRDHEGRRHRRAAGRPDSRRRRCDFLQLSRRSRPRNDHGARRSQPSTSWPIPKRPKNLFYVAMTQYDKSWPWLKYRNRSGKTRAHPGAGFRRRAVQKFALRGSRKNTRTSPIFSTAASKNRSTAKSACSCRRRKSQPTISNRKCPPKESPTPWLKRSKADHSTRSS